MNHTKIVAVLGGGSGGVAAASLLRKRLPQQHRVVLIDKESHHLFAPSLLWVMIGDRNPAQISKPLTQLKKRGIEVIQGEIQKITPHQRLIQVNQQTLNTDALIIALGADYDPKKIPGLSEIGCNVYTLEGVLRIRHALQNFKSGRIVILTAAPVYKCPAAPYEAAMLVEYQCRRLGIRNQVQIEMHAAEPSPMGTAGPELSAQVRQMIESKGIVYTPAHQVTKVDPQHQTLTFSDDSSTSFDMLIYVPPHVAPKVVLEAGLLADSGWVSVNRNTLETQFKDVYAIGDVTAIPLKMGKPLPKAGVFAHAQADVVAHNIATEWRGVKTRAVFDGFGSCIIEVGGKQAAIGQGNFYAEPLPQIKVKRPHWFWHVSKVLFEKYWLYRWF